MQRIMLGNPPNYVHTLIYNILLSVTLRLMHLNFFFLASTQGEVMYKCWNSTISWHPSMCGIGCGFGGFSEGGLVCKMTIPLIRCNAHC